MRFALDQLGKPYRWGGNGPSGYDCSGLTSMAYRSAGGDHPPVARWQYEAGRHIPLRSLAAGDLVFYASNTASPATIGHVGMYLGSGRIVEAAKRSVPIRIASMWRAGLMSHGVRPTSSSPAMLPVQYNQRGAGVSTVQARLRANGYCLAVDGAFGPITRATVQRFQRAHRLRADAVVGGRTWAPWSVPAVSRAAHPPAADGGCPRTPPPLLLSSGSAGGPEEVSCARAEGSWSTSWC